MARHADQPDFLATSLATEKSLLLGAHYWTVHNDSCSGKTLNTRLTMTGCGEEEFTCTDASCVGMEVRCDGKKDCSDGSDEAQCQAVVPSLGYSKFLVPPPLEGDVKLRINCSITISDIVEVNELKGSMEIKLNFKRRWLDSQLTYQNLKIEQPNNLSPDDKNHIWIPYNTFENIANIDNIVATDQLDTLLVIPSAGFHYSLADNTYIHNTRLFEGAQNYLHYERQSTVEWLCEYNTAWFPFDTQSCTMQFRNDEESVDFLPAEVLYTGPKELPQHIVKDVRMCSAVIEGRQGIIVEVILGRPLFSSFITITLPTEILIIISQMATSFSEEYLDMVIQVNLTVLLVLATL